MYKIVGPISNVLSVSDLVFKEVRRRKFGVNSETIFGPRLRVGGGGAIVGRGGPWGGVKLGSAELSRSKRIVIARKPQSTANTDLNHINSLYIY